MRWLARYATRVAVRRVVTVLVLALLAWVGVGRAEAGACDDSSAGCTREQAYAAAWALYEEQGVPNKHSPVVDHRPVNENAGRYYIKYKWGNTLPANSNGTTSPGQFYGSGCPTGTNWDEDSGTCTTECGSDGWPDPLNPGQCLNADKCRAKPPLGNTSVPGGFGACSGGCAYSSGQPVTVSFGGANPFTVATGWKATGEACSAADAPPVPMPDEGVCTPLGDGQTACKKPDGRICHTAPSGKQFCWQPGEVGEKTDGPDLQRTDPGQTPKPPNPLTTGDELIPEGQPVTSQQSDGNRTTTTVTQNYTTNYGTNAGSGPGQAEGGGNGGGNGNGNGDGEGDGDGGGVGAGVGSLYEGSGKTVDGVVGDFVERMGNAGIIAAAGNFMGNCSFAGNCPVWTWDGGDYAGTLTFDQLCSGALQGLFQYGGWIVMAMGAFAAFRIGVY